MKLYMFRTIPLSIIRSLFTVHSAMAYVIQVCRQLSSKTIVVALHVKCPLFLSDFNETWIVSAYFRNIFKYQISRKSVQWKPTCSMRKEKRTDGWTEGQTGRQAERQRNRREESNNRVLQFYECVLKWSQLVSSWRPWISPHCLKHHEKRSFLDIIELEMLFM
jgi:hypothetical protein